MGLTGNHIRFVLYAQSQGATFGRVATIGRQQLHTDAGELADLLRRYGYHDRAEAAEQVIRRDHGYAEPLFDLLGAEEARSFDASRFEGATDIHDFNQPLTSQHQQRFDVVLDSGSLEHVFHVTSALRNVMDMTALGGHVISIAPANNWLGHGFYQFSPEFFYRAFTEKNGFQILTLAFFEHVGDPAWVSIPDSASVGGRIEFCTSRPAMLALLAKRISLSTPFAETPQESDYAEIWSDRAIDVSLRTSTAVGDTRRLRPAIRRATPEILLRLYRAQRRVRARRHLQRIGLTPLEIP
jgi:hypothetical protein